MENKWIKTKEKWPPHRMIVMARNPFCESLSWVDGINELGKPSWGHENWEHADDFVSEWRWITDQEYEDIMKGMLGEKWRNGPKIKVARNEEEYHSS